MRYKSENELDLLDFKDAYIDNIKIEADIFELELEGVIIRARNSQNEQSMDSYAGPLVLRLENAKITQAFKEGFKYYNADNVLVDEKPDEQVEEKDIMPLFKSSREKYIFTLEKVQQETGIEYMLCIDFDEEDYWFRLVCDKAVAEWDKYLNRVGR